MCKSEKRFRPTLGQYKALEKEIEELKMKYNVDGCYDRQLEAERDELKAKLEEQIEGTSQLVRECDNWRDLYRHLLEKKEILEQNLSEANKEMDRLSYELNILKSRGFWARVFNK